MEYKIGQELIRTLPNGKTEIVTILRRAVDFENGFIDVPEGKGNFDYLVSVEKNGEKKYCQKGELSLKDD